MIKMTIQDTEETAEFKVLEKPIIQKPLIAESDVITIDNNLSTYVTGTQKRELTVGLGYLDSVGYETLRRIRDRQYAVLKYPTVTITADEPVDLGYGEDVPDYRQRLVQLKGKNLFDEAVADMLVARLNSAGDITTGITNRLCTQGYIPVTPNTTYTLSATPEDTSKPLQAYMCGYTQKGSTTAIGNYPRNAWYNLPVTFTTGANCNFIRISYHYVGNSNMTTTSARNQQLELGTTATTYESYYNIELCKIGDYQDYIYKSDDKWYVHKTIGKLELSSPTSISRLNTALTNTQSLYRWAAYYAGETLPTSSSSSALIPIYCSHFEAKTRLNTFNNIQGIAPPAPGDTGTQTVIFYASSLAQSSAEDVTTWLNNNNPVVYYQLATSTETEITNATLIAQLDALQNSAFDRWTGVETEVQELSLQPYLTVTQGEITDSGKEVMLEGTTEDLLDFVILGDTFQDGTPTPDSPIPVQTVNGDINFDFSGPSGVKKYTMVGKMTLAEQRIIDNCGTNEQVQVSFRESKQI